MKNHQTFCPAKGVSEIDGISHIYLKPALNTRLCPKSLRNSTFERISFGSGHNTIQIFNSEIDHQDS